MAGLVDFTQIPQEFTVNLKIDRDSLISVVTAVAVLVVMGLLAQKAIKKA